MDGNWIKFSVGDRSWLGFCVSSPNGPWFMCAAGRKWLGFVWAAQLTWVCRRNILWFPYLDRSWLVVFVVVSRLTWLWSGDGYWADFSVGVESNLILVWGIEIILMCGGNRGQVGLCAGDVNWLGAVWGAKITWFSCGYWLTSFLCGWSKLASILCTVLKQLGFSIGEEIELFFVRMVEINLNTVCGIDIDSISVWRTEID